MERRSEADKYSAVWEHDAYRQVAPGEHHVQRFIDLAKPRSSHVVCDFGCGTGRGARDLAILHNLSVCGVDFASNCLDAGVRESLGERFRFLQHDLTTPLNETFDFGFCTDVLEHIPPKDVDKVLVNIFTSARKVYLAISTVEDVMGALVGEPLHLTVKDPFWWHEKVQGLGFRVDWSSYNDGMVCFYGSAYANAQDFEDRSGLNAEIERIKDNIRKNLDLGLNEIAPHQIQDTVIRILAGGPSLEEYEMEIVELGKEGKPFVTVNGTHNWLLERGIKPAVHVMVDAREFNERFVNKTVDTCRYLVSSQCAHEAVVKLPKESTLIWHSSDNEVLKEVFEEHCSKHSLQKEWWPVYGGSTVISRAITLLAMLGFRKIEVYGWDSCLKDGKHHAYDQPENDGGPVISVKFGDKEFKCNPWMLIQANEVPRLVKHIWGHVDGLELSVRGNGLIAAIFKQAAQEAENGS